MPDDLAAEILALGEPMVEFNQTGERDGRHFLQGFGGDTSNFAIAAARQGARVGFIGALGDDRHAAMLRALWRAEGVADRDVKTDAQAFTAVYFVTHDARGHHFDIVRRRSAASRITPADLPRGRIARAKLLHLSGISLAISDSACETGLAAMALAREAGTAVSFDTNLRLKLWPLARARTVMTEAMRRCDLCLPSLDDIGALTGLSDPDARVDHCLALGARIVALKLGAAGALVASRDGRHRIAALPCRPVDATSAGDTFGGAFAARWLAGDCLREAGCYAAAPAALSTEGYGAVEPIPHADRVRAALGRPSDSTRDTRP
ncbi:MAG: sugar kinase [Burkholderiaceae bacterium]|nr:sugar kinase [Burkholderiaceae bacterium]